MSANKTTNIFIIAGEASGDNIGGRIMAALKNSSKNEIRFHGIGGEMMEKEGLSSMIPLSEISLMGFAEIVPHIPKLLRHINATAKKIAALKPDILITIDSPGFNYRVAKKIKNTAMKNPIKKLHIVAPTVWAYKPKRAKKTAGFFDRLLVLLPFEPPYFLKEGLATDYIGHPIIEGKSNIGNGRDFREKHGIPSAAPLLLIMPGSRKGELEKLLPVFERTVMLVAKKINNLHVVILSTGQFAGALESQAKNFPVKTIVAATPEEKADARAAASAALVKSGTGTLELALCNIPMVVAYKVSPLSAWLLKKMIKIKFATLINIILNREAIPEFIQEKCRAELIAPQLEKLLTDPAAREKQLAQIQAALGLLGLGATTSPSEKAAEIILKEIDKINF